MKEVILLFRQGPMAGRRIPVELGRVTLGRDPGPQGLLLPGDDAVSRLHGELVEEQGGVVYRNLSPNGTQVDRRIVQESEVLAPGARIHLGREHVVEVQFRPAPRRAPAGGAAGGGLLRSGPLARPAVRALLAVYLLGLLALAVFFGLRGESGLEDRFAPVSRQYAGQYRPPGVEAAELKARLARAERLVQEIAALERTENWPAAREGYRALMALDGDPESPVYRFAARRLGAIARKR